MWVAFGTPFRSASMIHRSWSGETRADSSSWCRLIESSFKENTVDYSCFESHHTPGSGPASDVTRMGAGRGNGPFAIIRKVPVWSDNGRSESHRARSAPTDLPRRPPWVPDDRTRAPRPSRTGRGHRSGLSRLVRASPGTRVPRDLPDHRDFGFSGIGSCPRAT